MKKRKNVLSIAIIVIILVVIGSVYIFNEKKERVGQDISVLNPGFETMDESGKGRMVYRYRASL